MYETSGIIPVSGPCLLLMGNLMCGSMDITAMAGLFDIDFFHRHFYIPVSVHLHM